MPMPKESGRLQSMGSQSVGHDWATKHSTGHHILLYIHFFSPTPTKRTDAEAEAPILWLPDTMNWLIRKDPDTGKDWRQEEKGTTEDKMVGWHHWLNGHDFEKSLGDGAGREEWHALVHEVLESDKTERLNNNNNQLRVNLHQGREFSLCLTS